MNGNNVRYLNGKSDPWFSANLLSERDKLGNEFYLPDRYFTAMACAEQIRFCANDTWCMPFTGPFSALGYLDTQLRKPSGSPFSPMQETTIGRILRARKSSQLFAIIDGDALVASKSSIKGDRKYDTTWDGNKFYGGYDFSQSLGLPNDQWQMEIRNWFDTSLATIQYVVTDFVTNEWYNDRKSKYSQELKVTPWILRPYLSSWVEYREPRNESCNAQLVRSTAQYQSFSLSGLVIVIIVSVALLIISWTLECCVHKRKDRAQSAAKHHKHIAHVADGKMQLLRMALKPVGYQGWTAEASTYPYRTPTQSNFWDADSEADIMPAVMEHDAVVVSGIARDMELRTPSSNTSRRQSEYVKVPGLEEDEVVTASSRSLVSGHDQSWRMEDR